MKILFTGDRPTAGSWKIRAEQLGAALGAELRPRTLDVAGYDVVVAVKRHNPSLAAACRAAGVPLVWDIVDAWPQPVGNAWTEKEARAWLRAELTRVSPRLVVASTRKMVQDIEREGFRAACIPHHAREPVGAYNIRESVHTVGYDGSLVQLGHWADVVEAECKRRGWVAVLGHATPEMYAEFDIALGLREDEGYAPRHWKSGVKLANAQAAGIPFVGSPEQGYLDLRVPGAERFVETPTELKYALDALTPLAERRRVAQWMTTVAPVVSLRAVAAKMHEILAREARA
jgi:hypothetical protein